MAEETETKIQNLILRAETLAKKNWIQAINLLEDALIEYPSNNRLYLALGDIYARANQYRKALTHFQSALAQDPTNKHLTLHVGNCYLALSEYSLALVYYDKVDDLPLEILYNKAIALAYQGQLQDSIQLLQRFIRSMDNSISVFYLLIELYIRVQELDQACHYIEIAEKKWGKQSHLLLLKAVVHAKREVWLTAYHAFMEHDRCEPIHNSDHLYTYAVCADKLGLSIIAIEILKRGLEDNPYSAMVYEDLVRILLQIGDYDEAYRILKKAKSKLLRLTHLLYLMKEKLIKQDSRYSAPL